MIAEHTAVSGNGSAPWTAQSIGATTTAKASKTALKSTADANLAAAQAWKAQATTDAANAAADLANANTLLNDLTKEISGFAREEITTRNALDAAKAA